MESRSMTTRSRRATSRPVSPVKQALIANIMGATKTTGKRSIRKARKVLADKTNATPVSGLVPCKSPKKTVVGQIKEEDRTPTRKNRSLEQLATPVSQGEDLLRSLVHSIFVIVQTPNGLSSQSPQADTPQFGVPISPYEDIHEPQDPTKVSTPSQQEKVSDERIEPSPQSDVTSLSENFSAVWVGRDVDEVTEVGEDDDSDCSVLVNVSSPGINQHLVGSPAPTTTHPTTPLTADFKWQRRESLKVREECDFNYYEDEGDDYEGCDEYDGEEFGQVDCDEICQGISRITVSEGLPEHKGRHIRFNYNSEDEIDVEEVDVMRLRGLPTPKGKHRRFPEDKGSSISLDMQRQLH